MPFFAERKQGRRLRREIASLKEQQAKALAPLDGESNLRRKLPPHAFKIATMQLELAELDTNRLVRKARRRGIQIPHSENWWWEDETFEGETFNGVCEGRFYLTESGKAGVSRLIQDDRKKSIEWWVRIITPVLSALIALLGVIVALVSVSRKR